MALGADYTMFVEPIIADAIFALRPDFAALSVSASGLVNRPTAEPVAVPCSLPWAESHFDAWRHAYRGFGAKPQRTPSSAEALRNRVERSGSVPAINAIVDLYNAISLRHAVPVGGEDAALFKGQPRLIRALGGEPFDTMADGKAKMEQVDQGEVVWRDDLGVTCRRWNWRQGVRTRISEKTTAVWFVLERLEPMPIDALRAAGQDLIDGLRQLHPGAKIAQGLIDQSGWTAF
ncbi:phenylalanine--tRNA ligase beta subunit-related protein [Novosphingobium sp. MMS21-SN21R]|uniref:B3/B4 domain-containing protein n=1 Tax=Novosphingobium sp. MMS21-SN21R TaxID=2969298 RepID=UPI002883B1F8|nr:phenylalanine--tRNA ligase beta subunit-related protein [Novosphingobium sp. MMS21-SN21R]MDT0510187.1 phenylalanine--tRNA ligase beta subunit-related protein [Novosphingobium sp. MMS21-SN21R]